MGLCMQTYFKFEGKIYEHLKGTPISGFIAEALMQKLEKKVLPRIMPKLWLRYVEDTFVILKKSKLERTYNIINNIFNDIKFTMEIEKAFLDILIIRTPSGKIGDKGLPQGNTYRSNPKLQK
ncbi:unnamed protein product [Echinostoma caproni]|uniref:Reverse transcriptase domain-containing protein n=1 Tax=Echinostoma caproni TaxID=27848 RepID=A0A183BAK9_9TREM|nr:unnamed protein product [Echinostoma caproni]